MGKAIVGRFCGRSSSLWMVATIMIEKDVIKRQDGQGFPIIMNVLIPLQIYTHDIMYIFVRIVLLIYENSSTNSSSARLEPESET